MKTIRFNRPVRTLHSLVQTKSQFEIMIRVTTRLHRYGLYGLPYGRDGEKVPVYSNAMLGVIHPFWVTYYGLASSKKALPQAEQEISQRKLRGPILERIKSIDRVGRQWSRKTSGNKETRVPRVPRARGGDPNVNDFSNDGFFYRQYSGGNITYQGTLQGVHKKRIYNKTSTSVSTPNFYSLKKFQRPWNPYSSKRISVKETTGTMDARGQPGIGSYCYGYIRGQYGQTPEFLTLTGGFQNVASLGTSSGALGKALDRAQNMSVNLAQAYAERRQTVSLLTSSVNRLVSLAIALRKGNFKRAKELSYGFQHKGAKSSAVLNKDGTGIIGYRRGSVYNPRKGTFPSHDEFASIWLEYQYGWRPLLSDIYGSCELIANTYYLRKPIVVTATSKSEKKSIGGPVSFAGIGIAQWAEMVEIFDEEKCRVVLQFREDDDYSRVLSQTGISNPLLLAWELLPYSFVLDWMIPVGDYLRRIDSLTGMQFVRGSTTTTYKRNLKDRWVQTKKGSYRETLTGSEVDIIVEGKTRSIFNSLPRPPMPAFKPHMGVERTLSAISLLSQVISKGKTSVRF